MFPFLILCFLLVKVDGNKEPYPKTEMEHEIINGSVIGIDDYLNQVRLDIVRRGIHNARLLCIPLNFSDIHGRIL